MTQADVGLLKEFADESLESLYLLDGRFVKLEKNPSDMETIQAVFRAFHNIKGNCAYFNLTQMKNITHELETFLNLVREKKVMLNSKSISVLLASSDLLKSMLADIKNGGMNSIGEDKTGSLIQKIKEAAGSSDAAEKKWSNLMRGLIRLSNWLAHDNPDASLFVSTMVEEARQLMPREMDIDVEKILVAGKHDGSASSGAPDKGVLRQEANKTMRISERSIDDFMVNVGDLVGIREMFSHLQRKFDRTLVHEKYSTEFRNVLEAFVKTSSLLQKSLMEIRKVPAQTMLQKVPRLIRDVATRKGKQIDVYLEGESIELDKSLIEQLESPLIHMVRNAADHGIESPAERIAAGKPAAGSIQVAVTETDAFIFMTVRDDGRGLCLSKLKEKAVNKGLIQKDQHLNQQDTIDLIFAPGFSTADEVTDISGRGVGLDVVKKNVEDRGGNVSLTFEEGKGCEFRIQIPKNVTTSIATVVLFKIYDQYFALPQSRVAEFIHLNGANIKNLETVLDQKVYRWRGEVVPILDLIRYFNIQHKGYNEAGLLQIFHCRKKYYAIEVSEILEVTDVVVKPLDDCLKTRDYFTGAAVMGDGRVAMLIDPSRLIEHMEREQ